VRVTVAETVLVYAVAPLAVIVLIVLLNLRGARRRPRYRPGQPWTYPPVWYEPHPDRAAGGHGGGHGQLEVGHSGHAALERAGAGPVLGSGTRAEESRVPGGPLGGARGTW
jgi:hypothetical protein